MTTKSRTLVGYIANNNDGTPLTDFNGKPTGWRVSAVVSNARKPNGDRVYVLQLAKGRGKTQSIGGGLWLGDGGTLFRGENLGRAPVRFDYNAWSLLNTEIVDIAERWMQVDLEDESREDERHSGNMIGSNPRRRMTLREEAAPFGLTPEGHVRLRKLTLAKAREEVRRFGYSLKKKTETDEYVLTPLMEREGNASYYTNDLSDAIATARDMSERRWRETRERGMGGGY